MHEASPPPSPSLDVSRLDTSTSFRKEAYAALNRAITAMDIYDHAQEIRLEAAAAMGLIAHATIFDDHPGSTQCT